MILTGKEIIKQVLVGRIHIHPFIRENAGPNSYDIRLGDKLKVYTEEVLDSKKDNAWKEILIPQEGFVLHPNKLYLGFIIEEIGSDFYAPTIHARSSIGRLGLSIYLNSGVGDLGFKNQWTLELNTIHPLKIYPGMRIGQIIFWKPEGDIALYDGKYKDSVGAETSKVRLDFNSEA